MTWNNESVKFEIKISFKSYKLNLFKNEQTKNNHIKVHINK